MVEVRRGADEAGLGESAVWAQCALQHTAQGSADGLGCELTVLVALVEESHDLVALLPLCDARSDLDDLTGAVRGGHDGEIEGKGVLALDWIVSVIAV